MKTLITFLCAIMLCGSLSAKHHNYSKYKRYTIKLKHAGEYYINKSYYVYLFKTKETNMWVSYLVKIRNGKPHLCCLLDHFLACMFFPFLKDIPDEYSGPNSYSNSDNFEGEEID